MFYKNMFAPLRIAEIVASIDSCGAAVVEDFLKPRAYKNLMAELARLEFRDEPAVHDRRVAQNFRLCTRFPKLSFFPVVAAQLGPYLTREFSRHMPRLLPRPLLFNDLRLHDYT